MLIKKLTFLLCLTCCDPATATMPCDSLLLRNYQFVKQEDAWLTSLNAAALTRFQKRNMAEAELSMSRQHGGFTRFDGSPDNWQIDAGIESFYRFSPRTVFYGGISYQRLDGRDMGGSVFIPTPTSRRPFDIVEDSLTTTGDKHLDYYRLTGAVGTMILQHIAVGARLDYGAANYAKYKDLRHQNKLMDLKATASIYVPLMSWLDMGAHYQYHRNIESVSFSTFGTNDKVYMSLVDYGTFMGKLEQFGNAGFTDKSHEMPLVDEGHGGGIQVEVRPMAGLSAFASLSLSHRDGYYGRKSPYTITYTNHRGDCTMLSGRIAYRARQSVHRLDLSYTTENLQNNAETFREQKNASEASFYEYYDPVETGDKDWKEGNITYTADLSVRGNLPMWTLQADYGWMNRQTKSYVFPYYRHQKLSNQHVSLSVTHRLIARQGVWSFSLTGTYLKGAGKPYEDATIGTLSSKQLPPPTMEAYLYREYQYLTSSQYMVGGQVKYNFRFPGTAIMTHARLRLSHQKANETNIYSDGCDRTSCTIGIGCSF